MWARLHNNGMLLTRQHRDVQNVVAQYFHLPYLMLGDGQNNQAVVLFGLFHGLSQIRREVLQHRVVQLAQKHGAVDALQASLQEPLADTGAQGIGADIITNQYHGPSRSFLAKRPANW